MNIDEAYKILELDRNASVDEIYKSYSKLYMVYNKEESYKHNINYLNDKKLNLQLERITNNEKKEIAKIKSAYNQRRNSVDSKFNEIKGLLEIPYSSKYSVYRNISVDNKSVYKYSINTYVFISRVNALFGTTKIVELLNGSYELKIKPLFLGGTNYIVKHNLPSGGCYLIKVRVK